MSTQPKVLKCDKTLFVDVDQTLVIWDGPTYTPYQPHIDYIKASYVRGHKVVVWSAGGWKWAQRIVKELELEPYISLIMAKPAWYIDDLMPNEFMPLSSRVWKDK